MKNFVRVYADKKTVSFSCGQQKLCQILCIHENDQFFHSWKKNSLELQGSMKTIRSFPADNKYCPILIR